MIGQILGNYRIVGVIGQGGMGVVYAAEHPLIGRRAAIKLLLPELSQNQEMVTRFFNEARATTMIQHPGLVDIFDFGHAPNGSAYIAMEFLAGESLAGRLARERPLQLDDQIAILRQLCSAVGAAHKKGIVHRDLKPDNVFLVPDVDVIGGARVKVLDFGIAKLAGDLGGSKTRTGSMMGTPMYMSPEQCRGAGSVDHRSDVYAIACIAFEMATGVTPFQGEGMGDIVVQHLRDAPPSPRALNPSVPPVLEAVILRGLAKRAEQRQQNMDEMLAELDHFEVRAPSRPGQRGFNRGGSVPPGSQSGYQPQTMAMQPGSVPPGSVPPSLQTAMAPGSMPPGSVPPGSMPPGSVPPQQLYAPQAATQSWPGPAMVSPGPLGPVTTLGGSAGQAMAMSSPPTATRGAPKWRWPAIALVAAGAAAGVFFATRGGKSGGGTVAANGPSTSASPSPIAVVDPASMPDPKTLVLASPPPEPEPVASPAASASASPAASPAASPEPVVPSPVAVAEITQTITSTPAGAEVFLQGQPRRLGVTPLEHKIAPGTGSTAFVLKLAGYKDALIELSAEHDDTHTALLEKRERKKSGPKMNQTVDPFKD
ncbi:MAG: protein kinase [Deltaproteobacteria bacterium]|nr:protein kinase [Deltaproteobacteria bacterium]